ncbi:EMC6 family protein, partial [Aspergillus homomorphus CBS 101889]
MPPTKQELSLLINPLVPESLQHNNRTLTTLHSLTSFLLGLTAGILSLQSITGFAFYALGTVLVSGLFHALLLYRSGGRGAGWYFAGAQGEIRGLDGKSGVVRGDADGTPVEILRRGAWRDVWLGGGVLGEALSGFVLGWAGV